MFFQFGFQIIQSDSSADKSAFTAATFAIASVLRARYSGAYIFTIGCPCLTMEPRSTPNHFDEASGILGACSQAWTEVKHCYTGLCKTVAFTNSSLTLMKQVSTNVFKKFSVLHNKCIAMAFYIQKCFHSDLEAGVPYEEPRLSFCHCLV